MLDSECSPSIFKLVLRHKFNVSKLTSDKLLECYVVIADNINNFLIQFIDKVKYLYRCLGETRNLNEVNYITSQD